MGFLKKKKQVKSPSIWPRVPEIGSDPPIGSGRDSGHDIGRAAGRGGGRRADGRQRHPGRAGRAQQGRGRRAAWVLGARPRRAGWPWAVHSVHSAYFRSVLTRYFS